MRLQPITQIVKTCFEGYGTFIAWEVADFVGDRVPGAMVFFWCGLRGRWDALAGCVRGVEVDHFEVVVEGGHYGFSGDAGREGRYGREYCFGHFERLSSLSLLELLRLLVRDAISIEVDVQYRVDVAQLQLGKKRWRRESMMKEE